MHISQTSNHCVIRRLDDGTYRASEDGAEMPGLGMIIHHQDPLGHMTPPPWLEECTLRDAFIIYRPENPAEREWFITGPGRNLSWAAEIKDGDTPPKGLAGKTAAKKEIAVLCILRKYKTLEKLLEENDKDLAAFVHLDRLYGDGRLVNKYGRTIQETKNAFYEDSSSKVEFQTHPHWKPSLDNLRNTSPEKWKEIVAHYGMHCSIEVRTTIAEGLEHVWERTNPSDGKIFRTNVAETIRCMWDKKTPKTREVAFRNKIPQAWKNAVIEFLLEESAGFSVTSSNLDLIPNFYTGEFHMKSIPARDKTPEENRLDPKERILAILHNSGIDHPREEVAKVWRHPETPMWLLIGKGRTGRLLKITGPGEETIYTRPEQTMAVVNALIEDDGVDEIPDYFQGNIFAQSHLLPVLEALDHFLTLEIHPSGKRLPDKTEVAGTRAKLIELMM